MALDEFRIHDTFGQISRILQSETCPASIRSVRELSAAGLAG